MKYEIWIIRCRSTTFYEKDLDDPRDRGEMTDGPVSVTVFDLEAFGGSVYYHKKTFNKHIIVNVDTNNFVFSSTTPFMDIAFMHHSLQPGEC